MSEIVSVLDADVDIIPVEIADSGTEPTEGIDLRHRTLVGVTTETGFDGTSFKLKTATGLSGTYRNVNDGAGADWEVTVAANEMTPINPADTAGLRYIKPVVAAQTGVTEIHLHVRTV